MKKSSKKLEQNLMINIYIPWNFSFKLTANCNVNGTFAVKWNGDDDRVKSNRKKHNSKRKKKKQSNRIES